MCLGGMREKVNNTSNNKMVAIICAIVNLFFWPGAGTAAAGIIKGGDYMMPGLCIGLCQFLLIEIIFGYIWAAWTSWKQFKCAKSD